ncbi:biofilm development protein YmgB/AriR [Pantoea sp. AG1095]|uniref:biofilm development regulator YmgB/AriR family protein n=1 Tax=Pantoea sp. AG1095 TaxID=2184004 RepID=UPI000D831F44|nr:biofilm development regulator YmgB/AriR family protein [Pantoea sp. AG1095]PYG49205.1 biofilm development protein YmgB/AriR [Pantoea sp. AG1095]
MQQNTIESDLQSYLHSTGDQYAQEKEVIGIIVKSLIAERGRVTNKAIIMSLIAELESATDIEQLDVLRNCLEIVVGRTPNDDN